MITNVFLRGSSRLAILLLDPSAVALAGLIAWTASLQHARNGIALVVLMTWNIVLTVVILDLREDQHRYHFHDHDGDYSEPSHYRGYPEEVHPDRRGY